MIFRFKELYYDKVNKEQRRIPLQEVASAAGVTKQAVSDWLRDDYEPSSVKFATLDKLCDYFKIRLDQLVVRTQDQEDLPVPDG